MSKINFSKVTTLSVVATDDGFIAQVTYKSGIRRGMTFERDERVDLLIVEAERAGVTVIGQEPVNDESPVDVPSAPSPNALVQILALSPEQAKHLEGADRLNFWRNGCLNVQVQHGNRAIKLACPKAVVTESDLVEFFTGWGWRQINGKPYFQATANSLVRL